jgi:hypothetical protein
LPQAIPAQQRKSPETPKTKTASAKTYQVAVSRSIEDLERDEIIAAIREVFARNDSLDRHSAIREISHTLGFSRTGNRIFEVIDLVLIVAVKRRIIANERGSLSLLSRNITDFTRDQLIDAMLGVMGRGWWNREDAIRAAARYLGYTRTGARIRDTFKSVINGAIRRGLLEADKVRIRKAK